jgi:uncharacterized iron-regulated membrane protein
VTRLFSAVSQVAQARLENLGRRLGLRAALIGACVLAGVVFLGFALAAATVALADRYGVINALAIMAAGALVVLLGCLVALAWEKRRHRRLAARRSALDREFMRTAALSMIPDRSPSRPTLGLGLVVLGAILVLMRRKDD